MNIRALSNPITPIETLRVKDARDVKMDNSAEDRDADGRRQEKEQSKDQLSDDEMRKAREYLENLAGLKTNGLTLEVEDGQPYRIFIIRDHNGQIARRIVEWEMRVLIETTEKKTGQIFDKSA